MGCCPCYGCFWCLYQVEEFVLFFSPAPSFRRNAICKCRVNGLTVIPGGTPASCPDEARMNPPLNELSDIDLIRVCHCWTLFFSGEHRFFLFADRVLF